MLRLASLFSGLLVGVAAVTSAGAQKASAETVTLAVAANFKLPAEKLISRFEAQTDHDVRLVIGSSGKLYAQILNGAPFDIFLSADQARPAQLDSKGLSVTGTRFTYATGILSLWKPGADETIDQTALMGADIRHIALANPRLAPYGRAAQEALTYFGLTDLLTSKFVMGENVGQTFILLDTGNAEIGFIARSQLSAITDEDVKGSAWTVPKDAYTPIRQDGVLLKRADDNLAAQAFFDYLKSSDAQALITSLGYRSGDS